MVDIYVDSGVIFFPLLGIHWDDQHNSRAYNAECRERCQIYGKHLERRGGRGGGGEGVGAGRIGGPAGPGFYYLGLSLPVPASLT